MGFWRLTTSKSSFVLLNSVHLKHGQPVMLPVDYKQLIYLVLPVMVDGRFAQHGFHFFFVGCGKSDPHALRFHRHHVLINGPVFDQVADVSTVGRDERHKLIIHAELYTYLEFFHAIMNVSDYNCQSTSWFTHSSR